MSLYSCRHALSALVIVFWFVSVFIVTVTVIASDHVPHFPFFRSAALHCRHMPSAFLGYCALPQSVYLSVPVWHLSFSLAVPRCISPARKCIVRWCLAWGCRQVVAGYAPFPSTQRAPRVSFCICTLHRVYVNGMGVCSDVWSARGRARARIRPRDSSTTTSERMTSNDGAHGTERVLTARANEP